MTDRVSKGWTVTTIGAVVEPKVHQAPPTKATPYIEISGVDRSTKRIVEAPRVAPAQAPTRARQWVRARDVLVSLTRPNLNAVALVPDSLDGAVASTGFDVLRAKGVLPEWLMYRVRSQEFVTDVCKGLQGVVYPAIRPKDVRSHRLPLPPIEDQRRVVDALDSYFSRLDEVEAGLERVQRNLKRYRASVLQAAVTGRLVPTEAELARAEGREYEPASVLLARALREQRKELGSRGKLRGPAPPATTSRPELPEGWCWASVDQIARHTLIGLVRSRAEQHRIPAGSPYVRMDNIDRDGNVETRSLVRVTTSPAERDRFSIRDGDILFNTRNSVELVGKTGLVRSPAEGTVFNNNLMRIRLHRGLLPRFIAVQLVAPPFREALAGIKRATTSVAAIYAKDLLPLPLAIPPRCEQERIANELDYRLSILDGSAAQVQASLGRIERLRQTILRAAFDGSLTSQPTESESEPGRPRGVAPIGPALRPGK